MSYINSFGISVLTGETSNTNQNKTTKIKTFCSLLADFTFEGKGSIIVAHVHDH